MISKLNRIAGILFFCAAAIWIGAMPVWGQPVSFIDDTGREITISSPPARVVSLVPSITEILFRIGAGDRVKGVTYHGSYPSEAATRPIIGGFFHPDMGRVKALQPDVVFYAELQREAVSQLGKGSWQLINLETDSIEDSYQTIRLLGKLFGCTLAAEKLIAENQAQLELIAQKAARIPETEKKRVMRLMGRDKLMVPGDDSFQNELIRAAGGIPPQLGKTGPVVEMTMEEFIAFDPQVIYGCGSDRETAKAFFNQKGYRDVSAVKSNRIISFPCDLTCRVATNTGYFVTWLSARVYGQNYARPDSQVQQNHVMGNRELTIDLPYIKKAHIVRSRIADFLHKTLIIDFAAPQTVLSTLEGQRSGIATIGNHYSPPPFWGIGHQMGLEEIRSTVYSVMGRSGAEAALLFTGADMDLISLQQENFRELTVWALVTAGVRSNAMRTSRDEGRFYEPGTINILIMTNARLSPRAMSRAVITATEAKSAALADLDVRSAYLSQQFRATGTGTDNIIVAEGAGLPIGNAGGHSKMGQLIATAVYRGVQEAVFKQNGLVTGRHIFARLAERGITPYGLISGAACDCIPDNNLVGEELEMVLLDPRYAGFLKAALAVSDDHEAGLIADTGAIERWCRTMADDIAGRELPEIRELIEDDTMPQILRTALNAVLNGVYGRLTPPEGTN